MDTTTLAARREKALGAGAPLFYDKPAAHRPRRGRVPVRRRRPPLPRHVQQRALRRSRQPRTSSRRWRASRPRSTSTAATCTKASSPSPSASPACTGPRSRASSSPAPARRPTRWRCAWRACATGKTRHRLHQRHVPRQQRGGRQDDPHRRRPPTPPATCAPSPFPETLRPLLPGASEAELARPISTACASAIRSFEDDGTGFAGADRVLDLRQRRPARRAARLHAARRRDRARRRRPGDRRRGPGRLLPHRPLVGLRGHRLHARHRRHRQADGQRPAAGAPPPRAQSWSTASARPRAISTPSPRARCRRRSAWPCSTSSSATAWARMSRSGRRVPEVGAGRAQGPLRLDRRRARPRAVRRRRDCQGRRGPTPDADGAIEIVNRLKDKGFLTSNAGAYRQRAEDPAAAGLRAEACRGLPRRLRRDDRRDRWIRRPIGRTFAPAALGRPPAPSRSMPASSRWSRWPRTSPSG